MVTECIQMGNILFVTPWVHLGILWGHIGGVLKAGTSLSV